MDEHGRYTIPVEPVFSTKVYDSSKGLSVHVHAQRGCTTHFRGVGSTCVYILCV